MPSLTRTCSTILFALVLLGLPTEAQQEADGRAFLRRLGETLERTPKDVKVKAEGEAVAEPGAEGSETDRERSDADDYWDDSEAPKDGEAKAGAKLEIVSATYGELIVERLRFPKAVEARTFALEGGSALGDAGVPVAFQQRGRYVIILYGPELKRGKEALRLLQLAWTHTPGKGAAEVSQAYVPDFGEVKAWAATSKLDLIQFDQLAKLLRDLPEVQVKVHEQGTRRAYWFALDPNLVDAVSAYANEFSGIKAWRRP